jgi:hypothetical protein
MKQFTVKAVVEKQEDGNRWQAYVAVFDEEFVEKAWIPIGLCVNDPDVAYDEACMAVDVFLDEVKKYD